MRILGIVELIILGFYIVKKYSYHGYLYFADISKVALILWLFAFGLYNLQISTLLKPSIEINIVGVVVIFNFWILSVLKTGIRESLFKLAIDLNEEKINDTYTSYMLVLFCLGVIAFISTYLKFGFTVFQSNKINRTELAYGYFYNALVVCVIYFLLLLIKKNKKFKKFEYLFLIIASLFMLICLLNRGNFIMIIMGAAIVSVLNFYYKTNKKYFSKKKIMIFLVCVMLFVFGFGVIGDLRFATVSKEFYHISYVELYGFKKNFPSGIGQLYIYITSPLENMSGVLKEQHIREYTWFSNLFYPAIKLLANLIGQGAQFANWVTEKYTIYPYLKSSAGLNVMSFMADAYQDCGYLGIIVYLFFYDVIIIFASKILKSNLYAVSKTIIYGLILQIIVWSVFSDSVFKIASIWVNIFFVYMIDFLTRKIKFKK